MEMSGEHRIPAPRETVWLALNDPAILKDFHTVAFNQLLT